VRGEGGKPRDLTRALARGNFHGHPGSGKGKWKRRNAARINPGLPKTSPPPPPLLTRTTPRNLAEVRAVVSGETFIFIAPVGAP